ncbi:MAG: M3 family metallopeptidase [Gammaproteobacteria bacterium]|nr:M3 family metallopeptidase [Gammaproteobacteria bacterium]MDH4315219.1 M3 family metallopeptidase [Gammaproteobacteria bacterium]MDH5215793.1 M3 family metallopeptidase [Gammaproteobacteria bacterium]MDH5500380.1 M3 family metallopeptidase [Gammaproteobacteria bacterium]
MTNPLLDTFSLPRFGEIEARHVLPALKQLIADHRQKLDALLADPAACNFESLVIPLESMSHELSRVWSPVSHLQAVLGDPEWREAYNAALPLMTEHGTEISQNQRLQQAYQRIADSLPDTAPAARKMLLEQELRDFRLAGVALPDKDKARYRELVQELAAVQARFEHNVQDAADDWHFSTDDEALLSGLPAKTLEQARSEAQERGAKGWWLRLDAPTYIDVITHADNRELRQTFYKAWATRASDFGKSEWDNSNNIRRILQLRDEIAKLIGFSNYAEYSLATKMATRTSEVVEFLQQLASRTRAAASAELERIRSMAAHPVEAWDTPYYLEQLKQRQYAISEEALRQYFPVAKVKEGLFDLASRLYGVTLRSNSQVKVWHESVRYYDVADESGEIIGGFYTDLFARSGKRGGAWIDECIVRKNMGGENVLPIGYLVCNFARPDEKGVSLLTHNDVLTMFHEFGHMLHHLLTKVDYPSLAGINGVPWDAVELPSQFMENFAWYYDVLVKASQHHQTGEVLPQEMFQKLDSSRHFGAALAMLRQIEFALFDFRLHTEYSEQMDVMQILNEVRDEVALIRHPDYNRMPHAFSHIFAGGYAAGYYSYKWAEVLAADAFSAFEESGIFDKPTAKRFRSEILEIGGSRDFMEAYVAFRGREPTIDALLRHSGIGKAA